MMLQRVPMLSRGYFSWRTRCLTSDHSCFAASESRNLPSPSAGFLSKWVSKTSSSWFPQAWRSLLGTNDKGLIASTLQAVMMSWVSFGKRLFKLFISLTRNSSLSFWNLSLDYELADSLWDLNWQVGGLSMLNLTSSSKLQFVCNAMYTYYIWV